MLDEAARHSLGQNMIRGRRVIFLPYANPGEDIDIRLLDIQPYGNARLLACENGRAIAEMFCHYGEVN